MLFSVIIPTYNREATVASTIQTVLKQTYKEFEIIVVDDGSTDNTRETITRLQDQRVRYFYKTNEERSIARNYGANQARGQYLLFLDSDDRLEPSHLHQLSDFITARQPPPEFMVSAYNIVNESGQVAVTFDRKGIFDKKELVHGNPLCCSPVTLKAELFRNYYFNTDPRLIIFEDWELWLRIISDHKLHCIPVPSVIICDHDQRSVLTTSPAALAAKIDFYSSHAVESIPLLKEKNYKRLFLGGLFTYGALHIAMGKQKGAALKYLVQGVRYWPGILFKKRFLGIIKRLLY